MSALEAGGYSAELVVKQGSSMTIRVAVPTAELEGFYVGARIKVMGQPAQIEAVEARQTVDQRIGTTWLQVTVLML